MKRNELLTKINWYFWFASTVITGIMAGFLLSHSVMLGRFFSWTIQSGNNQIFASVFAHFREESRANIHYNLFIWISLLIGILWTASSFVVKKNRIAALVAGLSSFWVGAVFFSSGFSKAEEAVMTGRADELTQKFFVAWNLPLHTTFAVFYLFCFILLLLTGIKMRNEK